MGELNDFSSGHSSPSGHLKAYKTVTFFRYTRSVLPEGRPVTGLPAGKTVREWPALRLMSSTKFRYLIFFEIEHFW